ncbi:MAG: beta-galactosidase [Clostridia bacterium]|nr:beta-galactosidase [Clostridia bacterium]
MVLQMNASRILPQTQYADGILTCPASGGGISIPEIRERTERYLNLDLEVLGDNAQAFELRLYGQEEEPRVTVRFGINPRFHTRVGLDLHWMDGHILFPGHRAGTQKIVCHGSRIAREEITKATLVTMAAASPVSIRLHSLSLDDEMAPVSLPEPRVLIDRFGQSTLKEWSGKTQDETELRERLLREAALPASWPVSTWTRYGGDARYPLASGTGFFTKKKVDGRWYLVDPEGCAFFSMGPDCVVARCDGRIDGLEDYLAPIEDNPDFDLSALTEPLNRPFGENGRGPGKLFSYERLNLMRAFGKDWDGKWQSLIVSQLHRLGMNTLGNWSDPRLFGRMPYVTSLPEFPSTSHLIFRDFPDVLSPEYAQNAVRCAKALEKYQGDPWMIGYFLRNEPAWAFVDGLIIADEVLRDEAETHSKIGLLRFLHSRYDTVEELSDAWAHPFSSFDDLRRPIEKASAFSETARQDLRDFSALLIDRYMRIPSDACRSVDPDHMILGMRWAWISDPLLVSGWNCFDVFSINCYAVDPTPALDRARELQVDLPVMIGEFHFGALDSGLPATGLEAVEDQKARADAYRYYVQRVAAHPQGVGCHWFQCYDQFALGRFDGENYNIGLFDITLRPYEEMSKAVTETATLACAIHACEETPTDIRPKSLPMIAY